MDAKKWNEEVDAKVKILNSLLPWLKSIEDDKESTWEDVVNAGRARRQIEMAILDVYSLQYFDKESARRWQKSSEIQV